MQFGIPIECIRLFRKPNFRIFLVVMIIGSIGYVLLNVPDDTMISKQRPTSPIPSSPAQIQNNTGLNETHYFDVVQEKAKAALQKKLWDQEKIWAKGPNCMETEEYDKILQSENIPHIFRGSKKDRLGLWSHFKPNFPCPTTMERVGNEFYGGKNVCGFSELRKLARCRVYSFGGNLDVSFERMIFDQTNCSVDFFEKGPIFPLSSVEPFFRSRAVYGLRAKYYPNHKFGIWKNATLKSIMAARNDSYVDIIKMDIDGGEWLGLNGQLIHDFPKGLPVGQLLVEIHVDRLPLNDQYRAIRRLFRILGALGLRAFFRERSVHGPEYWEYSFLSIRYGMFTLQTISPYSPAAS